MSVPKRFARLLAAAVLAAAAAPAAADVGLGAAFNDSLTVIVPIRTGTWLIEPQLGYSNLKTGSNTAKFVSPGVGFYLRKEVGPLFEAYFGGIAAYNKSEAAGTKITTFSIAPTVGIAHYLSKQFSVGVDAGLEYADGTSKGGGGDQDVRNIQTVTRIVVRGFFF